jgi:hypothetical protein
LRTDWAAAKAADTVSPVGGSQFEMRKSTAWLALDSPLVVVCAAFVWVLAALTPHLISSDGWLALVSGRSVIHHGLPTRDWLAVLTRGRAWVDQQWLGQLGLYGLERLGGTTLVLVANMVLVAGAFVAAAVSGRRRGGAPTTVAMCALLAALPFLITAADVRTQSWAYLPFVALLALLNRPTITRSQLGAVLALLVLWANVHGSVLLAASAVAVRGGVQAASAKRMNGSLRLGSFMLLAPWACLLASPYHVHLISYYRTTAFNPSFAKYLAQWAPTAFSVRSVPLFLLVFASVAVLGRVRETYSAYERLVLWGSVVVGLLAFRDWPFAILPILMFLPVGFDRALRRNGPGRAPRFGAAIALGAAVAAAATATVALGDAGQRLGRYYPGAAAAAAAQAASGAGTTVYAGARFGDWLLWTHPSLTRHLAFDVRYELLRPSELRRLALFDVGSDTQRALAHPSVYILDPENEDQAIAALRPDVRIVYETPQAVVAVARSRNS